MKLLHTADWHLGKKLEGFSRLPEQKEVLEEICIIAKSNNVDAILIAGDIYDTYNPPTEAVELFYKTVKRLSSNASIPVIVIAGNHDSPDRIEAPDPLAVENGIFLLGYPDSKLRLVDLDSGLKIINSEAGFAEFELPNSKGKLRVLFTPYANEQRLKKALDPENPEVELKQILQNKWETITSKYCDEKGVNILVSHHFFIEKGKKAIEDSDDEKPILYVGGAQAIETSLIPKQIQYTTLGHLHRYQNIGNDDKPVIYSGSPISYSFAEANQKKYVSIIEIDNDNITQLGRVPIEKGKKLLRKKFENIDEAVKWLSENQDALLELTIVADEYLSAIDRKRLYSAHNGIISIIPEIKNMNNAEDENNIIDLEQSREELFEKYFKYKKGQEAGDRILGLFREIVGRGER